MPKSSKLSKREELAARFMVALITKRPWELCRDRSEALPKENEVARGAFDYADAFLRMSTRRKNGVEKDE